MTERLRPLFCDHLSIMRGKYLPATYHASEARFCRSTFGVHFDKDLLPAPGSMMMEGLPDMVLKWEPTQVRDSWHEDVRVVVGDLYDEHGAPLPLCGRGALRRAVEAWKGLGYTPRIGIEFECFALQRAEDGSLVPYDNPGGVVYGTGPFTDPARFMDAIWETAEELDFRLEMMTAEYDAPQFEFTLRHDDALAAMDEAVLFRLMAREIALEHGVLLTFLPKPLEDRGGSGLHFNVSLDDERGENAFATGAEGGPGHMTDLMKGCVAGLVHHHKGLAGLLAPTANSYHRLQPASLSGYWKNWGGDHRNVTTRVPAEGGAKARFEHRMADAAANPYTAAAAVLQAARLGVTGGYDLPPKETGDGFERTDATEGVAGSLAEALDDLEADTALAEAVGADLVANQLFMRRQEVEKTGGLEGASLRDFYVWYI